MPRSEAPGPEPAASAGPGSPDPAAAGLAADLALLLRAAQEGGRIALDWRARGPEFWEKPAGAGPVSEADLAVDRFLRRELTHARPEAGWLSEETRDTPGRLTRSTAFVVDPIDGTRAYLAGSADWALSLALVRAGRVVAGVVHLPVRGLTYSATADGPARLNGAPIHAAARAGLQGAQVLAPRRALRPELWPGGVPPVAAHFRASLAWRLALVAEGRFDAMLSLRDCWEWDIAAGSLIAARAGAALAAGDGSAPRFNRPRPQVPGLIAAAPALLAPLLARLHPGAPPPAARAQDRARGLAGDAEPGQSL